MMFQVSLVLLFGCLVAVKAYSTGPPDTACASMEPGHTPNNPQASATPFTVTVSKNTYNPAEQLTVTINTSGTDKSYKGIFVQARHTESGQAVGSWTAPTGYKLVGCNSAASSALSHSSGDAKTLPQRFSWTAPASSSEQVIFYATVVRKYDTYWVKTPSASVAYNSQPTISATASTVQTAPPDITPTTPTPAKSATSTMPAKSTQAAGSSTTEKSTTTTSSSSKVVFSIHIFVIIMSLLCFIA